MAQITIPEVLARVAQISERCFAVTGETVAEAVTSLCELHPGLREHLYHDNGSLKDHFLFVVGSRACTPETGLGRDDELAVMLATSGGTGSSPEGCLSAAERARFARHIVLPQVGEAGQLRLRESRVLIVGTGGLGSPIAMYLAAAGVGTIGLCDFDTVDESNLQRQIVHSVSNVGKRKVDSARERLVQINEAVTIRVHDAPFSDENAIDMARQYDVVVDGCDNYQTRYAINDACWQLGKPYVYGSIHQFHGQASVFVPGSGPCYRCLYPSQPPLAISPNAHNKGVFGVLPGIVGVVEATEALKLLLGIGDLLIGRLLTYDALPMRFAEIAFSARATCTVCAGRTASADARIAA